MLVWELRLKSTNARSQIRIAAQLFVQLVDRGRHRKVTSERVLEVRPLTGYVVNQQYANHATADPIALDFVCARAIRLTSFSSA